MNTQPTSHPSGSKFLGLQTKEEKEQLGDSPKRHSGEQRTEVRCGLQEKVPWSKSAWWGAVPQGLGTRSAGILPKHPRGPLPTCRLGEEQHRSHSEMNQVRDGGRSERRDGVLRLDSPPGKYPSKGTGPVSAR